MKVAYLINQYPQLSHSFIRREILALEGHGLEVVRLSVRPPGTLIDPGDRDEATKTTVILALSKLALIWSVLVLGLRRPFAWIKALATAVRLARRGGGWLRHLAYFVEACQVVQICERANVDHLHAHFGTNPAAVALLARTLGGKPYSFTVHGPEEFDRPDSLSLSAKIAASKFVVGVSSFGRSQLYRQAPITDWDKVQVIHCGVDASFLAAEPNPVPDVLRLVCVGRLREQKGQLLLVRAAALARDNGLKFTVALVGDGPLRGEIEAEVVRLKLQSVIEFLGPQSGEGVRRELLASRAMVLPSFAEGLPVVLMEALAVGRPVITTFIAGIPELVESGTCGWVIPAGSVEELAQAMSAALTTPVDRLTQMGKSGAVRVAKQHDAIVEGGKLAELFRQSVVDGGS